jgi:HEAT repeat protein
MKNTKLNLLLAASLILGCACASAQTEAELIATLNKPDASLYDKVEACRLLGRVGTRNAVPVLASLLADEKLNHSARYGLETIPDPAVEEALRAALPKLQGRPLVGVIISLGVRKDVKAIGLLSGYLSNADADVAQAAARALGSIGGMESAKAIESALAKTPAENRLAFCEGLFRCAEGLAGQGQKADAQGIYDRLRAMKDAPHQVRAGALRGAILVRGDAGLPLLMEAIRSDDFVLVDAAARTAMEMKDAGVTRALADELGKLPADKQVVVCSVLGRSGNASVLPALFALAKSANKTPRLAAIKAIPEIGHGSAVPVLAELMADADNEVAKAAQEALASIPGAEADQAVLAMAGSSEADKRLVAIEMIARRHMTSAMPTVQKLCQDKDNRVRNAALRRLGEISGPEALPLMLELLSKGQDTDAVEQAIIALCTRVANPEAAVGQVAGALSAATPTVKSSLLRVLGGVGGPAALKALQAALNESDREVRLTAIRSLGGWRTAEPAQDLLAVAQKAGTPAEKQLCLRSYFRLANEADLQPQQRLELCLKVSPLCQKADEKKLLLSALSNINTPAAMNAVLPMLEDADVKNEANVAALGIAERILKSRTASARFAKQLVEPLKKVVAAAANDAQRKRAEALLAEAEAGGRK